MIAVEITKQAFDALKPLANGTRNVIEEELARKVELIGEHVHLIAVQNHVELITQYYVQDINA